MSNFYEVLGVEPSASAAEIENKLDEFQDELRQKVTHHDPAIVADANQKMQVLEEIRSTLMDDKKRQKYDESLNYGGLGDPNAEVKKTAPFLGGVTPRIIQMGQAVPQGSLERTDAWICPKDKHANAVGEKFCAKCSTQIGADCPNCGRVAELSKKFCPSCGVNKIESFEMQQAQKISELKTQKNQLEEHIGKLAQAASSGIVTNGTLKRLDLPTASKSKLAWALSFLGTVILCGAGISGESVGIAVFFAIILSAIAFFLNSNAAKTSLDQHIESLNLNRASFDKRILEESEKNYGDLDNELDRH